MKKITTLCFSFIFSFILFALFMIPTYADIVSHGDYKGVYFLSSFNAVRGIYTQDEDYYDHICYYVGNKVLDGTLTTEMTGTFGGEGYELHETQTYYGGVLIGVEYAFEDTVFYQAKLDENYNCEILKDEEFDISTFLRNYKESFIKTEVYYYINGDPVSDSTVFNSIKDYAFCYLMGITYTYNESYIDSDLHATVSYNNKKTTDEILADLNIIDISTTSYEVINNTYDNESATIGQYFFTLVAWDASKNVTIQKIYVDVVDVIAPKIIQKETIKKSYKDEVLTEADVLAYFEIEEESGYTATINMDSYLATPHVVGDYAATITAVDQSDYNNQATYDFYITVEDTIPPLLAYSKLIHTDYHTLYTKDEIKALFSAFDEYDGYVYDSIEIEDLDDYENNYMNLGAYNFTVSAKDSSNNTVSVNFIVYVEDQTAPILTIEQYIILTEKGKAITKDQILSLFHSLGYTIEGDALSSDCFSLDSLDGEYDLYVDLGDGEIEYDIVTTEKLNDISFEIPEVEEHSINLALILSLSIGGGLLVALGVMGVIIYKKRH